MNMTILGLAALAVFGSLSRVEAVTWSIADFGARGDAIQTLAVAVSNSTLVNLQVTNRLSAADVGKLIELFGVGAVTSGTNNQDLIGSVLSVADGTNVTISVPATRTATNVNCTIGSQNAVAFQKCVDACQGTNTTVLVPGGSYLLVPPSVLDPGYVMTSAARLCLAVSISKGGIRFRGESPDTTRLLGNGAWVLKGAFVQRGMLFGCVGPVTNDAPLAFENLTFDGGVQIGNQHFGSGPASPLDGSGWDITHGAVIDMGQPPFHANKQFINCHIVHWRGEMFKSVTGTAAGFIAVTNCSFVDGDASGFNFTFAHRISGCLFSNLAMAMEFYVGLMPTNSVFENNIVTNTLTGISLVGALTNHPSPGYDIISNTISAAKYDLLLGPARNVKIAGNIFLGGLGGITTDSYAYQGTDINRDILVENNQFKGTFYPLGVCADGQDRIAGMTWRTNMAWGCATFASGYGWSSNIVFIGNSSFQPMPSNSGLLDSSQLSGQWFIDDKSNHFPTNQVNISYGRLTNIISYSSGMRQQLNVDNPHGICLLDTSLPGRIPPGAELMITNASACPVSLYFTSAGPPGSHQVLSPRDSVVCAWTNGTWKVVQPNEPDPPDNLRVISP